MSKVYGMAEGVTPEQENRKENINQLFCGALNEVDAAYLYDHGIKNIERGLVGISDAHLEKFSENFAKEDLPRRDDEEDDPLVSDNRYALYNAYRLLRAEGFAHDEVVGLCEATQNGQLELLFSGEIARERAMANEFVAQSAEKIAHADEALSLFAEQVRGQNSAYQKPRALFTGKYQNLVIFSGNSSEVTPSTTSIYSSGENVVLVHIKNLAAHAEFDEAKISSILHTYVHENVHSIGVNTIEKGAQYLPLDPTSADVLSSGFFHKTVDDKKFSLYSMNEATTEYFARQLSNKAGFEGYKVNYQPHVACLEKLFAFIEKNNPVGLDDREQALKGQYGSPDGIAALRSQLESEIGPFALEVCDTLFDISEEFEQFLSSVRRMKKGEQIIDELWVAVQRLTSQFPQLQLSEIRNAYPFLRFGTRAYDEKMKKIIWKEVHMHGDQSQIGFMMEGQEHPTLPTEKTIKWESIMTDLNAYGSKEGDDVPIDEGIKECVTAFNMLGMQTTMSCAGHPEEDNMAFPTVQGILEDDPVRSIASGKSISVLLEEFNIRRSGPFILHLNPAVSNGFRVESAAAAEGERMMLESEDGFDRKRMRELKLGAQAEFQAFTEFLKQKVFGEAGNI